MRGVIIAPLTESHLGRIILGGSILFLRDVATCNYPPGTPLEVAYTEQDGRKDVDTITAVRPISIIGSPPRTRSSIARASAVAWS